MPVEQAIGLEYATPLLLLLSVKGGERVETVFINLTIPVATSRRNRLVSEGKRGELHLLSVSSSSSEWEAMLAPLEEATLSRYLHFSYNLRLSA